MTNDEQVELVADAKKGRSFKVKLSEDSLAYGRYNGDSPYQAANKALSEIIRNKVKNSETIDGKINFWLIESTKGSQKRVHQYEGERIKLAEPVKYLVGENEIVKEYKNILKKIKKAVQEGLESTAKVDVPKAAKSEKKVTKVATKKVTKVATKAVKSTKKTTKVATKAVKSTKKTTKATTKKVKEVAQAEM
jgi:hypothetical protein